MLNNNFLKCKIKTAPKSLKSFPEIHLTITNKKIKLVHWSWN